MKSKPTQSNTNWCSFASVLCFAGDVNFVAESNVLISEFVLTLMGLIAAFLVSGPATGCLVLVAVKCHEGGEHVRTI